ncbi:putative reverse transcriptase domain, viral movement protein [Tanacetum coccineum]|uniref:RNA-directed DNA polymerase n=1 Tax=Tanacetum coccineum TaxID=301880 RepID=A0ABQ4Z1D8_9ASTR
MPQNTQFIAPVIKPQKDYKEFDNVESFEHLFMAKPENAESTVQLQGCLRDWYHSLGEYRQLQIQQSISPEAFMIDDVNLKQVFLNSFPESLGNEAYRALEARNVTIAQTTLGELYQLILNALAKLCNQKKFLAEFERTRKRLGTACDDKYLQIKCKDKSSCDCTHIKKKFHSKRFSSLSGNPQFSRRSSKKWKFINSLESDSDFGVHMINPIPHVLPVQDDPPLPLAKVHLLTDAYAKPIPVIAFFDTGSSVSILNPNILPDHYWKPHHQNFMAANGEKFVIDKISVPINIRLFPKCVIKRRLLGSSSHGKDLLIGFDILHKLPNLRWSGEGLHYRSFFNPWTAMHRLFVASITPPIFNISSIKQRLIQTYCASSHTEFLTKHPSPLWLNPSFFVSLPFKQNEDVNPTKASHPGMNPDHYQLAKEECEQLVSQGIIEPTTSTWASDDKFLLSQKKSLIQHLADARVLSKFDLKSGFWQLGIKPEDRPKTAFCIPDHHYQWKSHAKLLSKFYSLVAKYGIMLSEKKMEVGFPDELSSQKMIQQFLGLVNCMADFLLKLSHHTALLFPMLKKNPPQWTSRQTEAVKAIKYKSGTFKASEQHYHSTFKEILAVKQGIEKFQFHLIGYEFQVEMDMSSFLRMLQFKRKMFPHAQLLRWSNWFLQWKFTVKYIKGTENVLADFLSRPKAYKLEENYPKDASRVQKHTPHFLSMVFSVTSHKEEGSSSNPTPTIPVFDLPKEIVETIGDLTFEKRAKLCYKTFLTILLKNHGLCIKGLSFTIGITFNAEKLLSYVVKSQFKDVPPTLNIYLPCYNATRSLMARANGVDPDKIPYYVMWNISCMRTRNSHFPNNSNVTIPRRRNRGHAPNIVEPEIRTIVEVAPMAEQTMEELLCAPTEGYGEAIVLPEINADHFEIKTNLLQLVVN